MAMQKLERSCRTPAGWRLATVEEVENNKEWIKQSKLLDKWDRARLLDGWIGGEGYEFHVQVGFRSCLGYMLVVQTPTPDIISTDDRDPILYSSLRLSKDGRSAALLLCSEDWNYEVLLWLIEGHKGGGRTRRIAIIVDDETEAASKLVSAVARQLHGLREKKRVSKSKFSCASMIDLAIDILESVKPLALDNAELALDLKERHAILSEEIFALELEDLGGQCWEELGLTEDLERFRWFGFNTSEDLTWGAVADTVWYVLADAVAVVIVAQYCNLYNSSGTDAGAERKTMDDSSFAASLIGYAHEILDGTFTGTDSLWRVVKEAATEAKGDCNLFNAILRDQGYGTFKFNGKYDVLNTFLVHAAKKGDVGMVQRLIESGVKPSETDDERRKTALHHAAKLDDELKGLEIAIMLLTKESDLANAVDHEERTPLHRAAFCGHARMCGLLLLHNASLSSKDKNGQTALHHALLRREQSEEVVRVLLTSPEAEDNVESRARLVDAKDNNGDTPLDFAVEHQGTNVRMVAWLLSLSSKPQSYFKELHLSPYLRESSRMGYAELALHLVKEGADFRESDNEGKTILHYAAEGASDEVARNIVSTVLRDKEQNILDEKRAAARDKYGRNVLHVAAFLGHKGLCKWLLGKIPNIDTEDSDGQSAIYYAVAGSHDDDEVLDIFIFNAQVTNHVFRKDVSQRTPLHVAAERGNLKMVEKLLSKRVISGPERNTYVQAADVLGQTALHKAAYGGHRKIVKKLLDEGAHPLEERDSDGRTALHYAAQSENDGDAMAIAKLLLNSCKPKKQKLLLLFASAVGIGYAEQCSRSDSSLRKYLAEEKGKQLRIHKTDNLLRVAATLGHVDMTRELLTRGANIADIRSQDWRGKLIRTDNEKVENVIKQIAKIVEQGTDAPALSDNLGRSAFADGLAALFLNPFVKSPITVGITGEWGMGKSSLMVQTERILITTAAQLAFSNSFQTEDFPGASGSDLSVEGETRRRQIVNRLPTTKSIEKGGAGPVLQRLDAKKWDCLDVKIEIEVEDPLYNFLGDYDPKYHQIYKSLAVMDRRDMFEQFREKKEESGSKKAFGGVPWDEDSMQGTTPSILTFEQFREKKEESGSRSQAFGGVPWDEDSMQGTTRSILTVRYNAWQYRNESEAWAGLAVEITKELEATMTVAHKLRTSWRYNWTNRRNSICFGVILPCSLALLVAIWFTTILWLLLDRVQSKDIKDFKYGSLPISLIVAAWGVGKSVMSFVKPISSQVVDYICLPDHSQKLGYHQKVISDINFLKDELTYRPTLLWKVFAFIWCCITFCWHENYVPGTMINKMPPACNDNLRIVVFVDDLDRCQENVILQILSAVHLVLAACEINVILGMDKSMIERAIIRKFGDKSGKSNQSNQDLAEKYLRKIIQLPLDLPDPSELESQNFLQGQLGVWDSRKGSTDPSSRNEIQRKVNPKYQMGNSVPNKTKQVRGEATTSLVETGAKQEKAHGFSDTAQQGLGKTDPQEAIGKPAKGSEVEETKNEIAETTDLEQGACLPCFKCNKLDESKQVKDAQKERKAEASKRRFRNISSITTEMLIPKYSEGERNAFCFLHRQCTGSRKLPREWKCLLTYHRLAWNILTISREVIQLSGWQVQFIAWVFVCWQWKHLITTLVQKWHDLGVLRNWIMVHEIQKGGAKEENSGPSLREIVEGYIEDRWRADKKGDSLGGDNATERKEDTIANIHQNAAGVNNCSSTREVDKSRDLPSANVRAVLKEEKEQKRRHFLKVKGLQRPKKGKRQQMEQDGSEEWLKSAIRKVLQEEEVTNMLKAIMKEAFNEERERGKQLREVSNSYVEDDDKRESSLQQGTAVKENQTKASHKASKNDKSKANDEEKKEEWKKLKETLSHYNVSMDCIQAFQKFRFFCEPGYLPWPLPKQA